MPDFHNNSIAVLEPGDFVSEKQAEVERWHPVAYLRTMSPFHGKGI